MNLGLYKNLTFNSGKVYPYATGGDYVYLYEEGNKTYRVHEFLSTGTSTLNVEVGGQMDILVVGGGGGGGIGCAGAGGGGGGVVVTDSPNMDVASYTVTVGAGAVVNTAVNGNYNGLSGGTSSLIGGTVSVTSNGGGGGFGVNSADGGDSGSFVGGSGQISGGCQVYNGGGGGAGAAQNGSNVISDGVNATGGDGGNGVEWPTGSGRYYGGGGGGGLRGGTGLPGNGGLGGGGNGGRSVESGATFIAPQDGAANTGGGGGGMRFTYVPSWQVGGVGGSGIVIVRYVVAEKKLWTPSELNMTSQSSATWIDSSVYSSVAASLTDKLGKSYDTFSSTTYVSGTTINNNFAIQIASASDRYASGYVIANVAKRSVYFVGKITVAPNSTNHLGIVGQSKYVDENYAIGFKVENTTSASSTPANHFALLGQFSFCPGFDYSYPIVQISSTNTSTYFPISGYHIFCATANYDTGVINLYANGVLVGSSTGNSQTLASPDQRGGGIYYINGTAGGGQGPKRSGPLFGEFIVNETDDDQNNSETRKKMEGYLAHKWGLTNNLPSGHPYKYEPPYKVEPEEIVTDGLVLNLDAGDYASYPRSGTTWYDISGNGLNGTLTNGPTYDSANKGSIVTDGSDDYILVGRIPYTSSGTQSVTWSLWTKPSSTFGNIMSMSSTNPQGGWNMPPISASGQKFIGKIWSNSQLFSSTYSLDTWYNLTLVWNYSTTSSERGQFFYVNGELVGSQTNISYSASNAGGGNFHFLGQSNPGANNTGMYSGKYGQFCVYNRALSSTEITQNFNALRGRYGI